MLWHLLLIYHVSLMFILHSVSVDSVSIATGTPLVELPRRLLVSIDPRKTTGDDDEIDNDDNHDDDPDNRSHPRSVMCSLLHLIMLMMMTALATPADTGTNSPTVNVHLPSPPPVLILMRSVSFNSVAIVTSTPDDDYSW